jgi:hypothetical protein
MATKTDPGAFDKHAEDKMTSRPQPLRPDHVVRSGRVDDTGSRHDRNHPTGRPKSDGHQR